MKLPPVFARALAGLGLAITLLAAHATPFTLRVPISGMRGPTAAPPVLSNVLLLHGDGANGSTTITSDQGPALTNSGGVVYSSTKSKFGGSSLFFNGSSCLTLPAGTFTNFGSQDFTVEGWYYATANTDPVLFSYGNYVAERYRVARLSSSSLTEGYWAAGSTSGGSYSASASFSFNTWHHVAQVRGNGQLTLFLDGHKVGSLADSTVWNTSYGLRLGCGDSPDSGWAPGYYFTGYLDEFRLTVGTALYTGDFTPPSQPF